MSASATPILSGVYTLSNTSVNGSALSGTLTVNANGIVTAANLTYANQAAGNPTFSTVTQAGVGLLGMNLASVEVTGSAGQVILQYLPTANANGSIQLCLLSAGCGTYGASYLQLNNGAYTALTAGTLNAASAGAGPGTTATAVTPEPASLWLLGTGVLAMVLLQLRRGRKRLRSHDEMAS